MDALIRTSNSSLIWPELGTSEQTSSRQKTEPDETADTAEEGPATAAEEGPAAATTADDNDNDYVAAFATGSNRRLTQRQRLIT